MEKDYTRNCVSIVIPYRKGFVYILTAKDNKWGLPGGKIDPFEDINVAYPREVKEETGLDIVLKNFLGIWDFRSERGHSITNRVFYGEVIGGELSILKPQEISDVNTLSLSQIRDLLYRGELRAGRANLEPVEAYLREEKYPLNFIRTLF